MENNTEVKEKRKRGRPKSTEIKPPIEKPAKKPKTKEPKEKPPPKKRGRKSKAELEALKNQSLNTSIMEENSSYISQKSHDKKSEFEDLPELDDIKLESSKSIPQKENVNLKLERFDQNNDNDNKTPNDNSIIKSDAIPEFKDLKFENIKTLSEQKSENNEINQEKFQSSPIHHKGVIFSSEYENIPKISKKDSSKDSDKKKSGSNNTLSIENNSLKQTEKLKIDYIKFFSQPKIPKCCSEIFNPEFYRKQLLKRRLDHKNDSDKYLGEKKIKAE